MSRSFVTPFNVSGGRIATTTDAFKITDQKVIDVLVTGNMERPTLPDYGAGAQQLLFEAVDELVEQDFKTDAGLELSSRVSGLNLIDIRMSQPYGESSADVTVYYRTALSAVRSLTFTLSTGILDEESPI